MIFSTCGPENNRLTKKNTLIYSCLLSITNAAITPGTQPKHVRINTIRNEPQPRSTTASGGKIIANNTLMHDIIVNVLL